MGFHPAPTAMVKIVDEKGNVIKETPMNRRQRRQLGVRRKKLDASQTKET